MPNPETQLPLGSIPAAQYVRMSDEQQQYSIDNQKAAIREYANSHGFSIVRTYADEGKSGVEAKHRPALRQLLRDVVGGQSNYKAVLVYDVSRWGRFPNADEAAYYEFICYSSGTPLHYCAERFSNDGTLGSALLKSIKRVMAAEFSRELGEKVFRGKSRLVEMGFWVGGRPGYGLRRMMVSRDGKAKQLLGPGEYKSLQTDRVILVPGPPHEVKVVRKIFLMAGLGKGASTIARELNTRGLTRNGLPWRHDNVTQIVRAPTYMGCNTWNRRSEKMRGPCLRMPPERWITKQSAFVPLVDEETFNRAQANLPRLKRWSKPEMLRRLRRLLRSKGKINETLMKTTSGIPSTVTIQKHFGSYRKLYDLLGYRLGEEFIHKCAQSERSLKLRKDVAESIKRMFPTHVDVSELRSGNHWKRVLLLVDHAFVVSILLCRPQHRRGKVCWKWEIKDAEKDNVTLLCKVNASRDHVLEYHLVPNMRPYQRTYFTDSRFNHSVHLKSLAEFYQQVKKLWTKSNAWRDPRASTCAI
jgi:DNA invertase Pin-like site-specific DNA recombinase